MAAHDWQTMFEIGKRIKDTQGARWFPAGGPLWRRLDRLVGIGIVEGRAFADGEYRYRLTPSRIDTARMVETRQRIMERIADE